MTSKFYLRTSLFFLIPFCIACKKTKLKPIVYLGGIVKYAHDIERDTVLLNVFEKLSLSVSTRGEYCVRMTATEGKNMEQLKFHNVNLEHQKMYSTFDETHNINYGILEKKTGFKLFTPQFYDFWEALFKQVKDNHLLSVAHTVWGYKLKTTLSDSTYSELAKTDYFDSTYHHYQAKYRQCGEDAKYKYEILLIKDLIKGEQAVQFLSRQKTIRKLSDNIYILRTTEYSEFDIFSDVPEYYCRE